MVLKTTFGQSQRWSLIRCTLGVENEGKDNLIFANKVFNSQDVLILGVLHSGISLLLISQVRRTESYLYNFILWKRITVHLFHKLYLDWLLFPALILCFSTDILGHVCLISSNATNHVCLNLPGLINCTF